MTDAGSVNTPSRGKGGGARKARARHAGNVVALPTSVPPGAQPACALPPMNPGDFIRTRIAERWKNGDAVTRRRIEGEPLSSSSNQAIATALADRLRVAFDDRVVADEGSVYAYAEGRWRAVSWGSLEREVATYAGALWERQVNGRPLSGDVQLQEYDIRRVPKLLYTLLQVDGFFQDKAAGIAFQNGFVRFDPNTGAPSMEALHPDQKARALVPLKWRGIGLSPGELQQTKYLSKMLAGVAAAPDEKDRIALLQEICAVAALGIATRLKQPKMPILIGPPNSGKSTLLRLIGTVCNPPQGSGNGSVAVKPHKWGQDYDLARLPGVSLNLIDELPEYRNIPADAFKSVITGDFVSAREPYRPAFSFRPRALHVVTTNHVPRFDDRGMPPAVQRRVLPLKFEQGVNDAQADPDLAAKVLQHEGDVLAAWIVDGAARVVRTGDFTIPPSSREVLGEWVDDADPFGPWFDANCTIDPKAKPVPAGDALATYHKHLTDECGYNRNHLPTIRTFNTALREKGVVIGPYGNQRHVKNVRFRGEIVDAKTGIRYVPGGTTTDADEKKPF